MRSWTRMVAVAVCVAAPMAAAAKPLTCDTFRERLNGGLIVVDVPQPEAPVFQEKPESPDGGRRYNWSTSRLSGTLTCDTAGSFREFYVALEATSKERFADQIKRVVSMNGAAICSVVDATPSACVDAGKRLLQSSLQLMGLAFQRKVTSPSGLTTGTLAPHIQADLTAAPTLITFTLDVDAGSSLDEARQPLDDSGSK